jgi:hypothetical protein
MDSHLVEEHQRCANEFVLAAGHDGSSSDARLRGSEGSGIAGLWNWLDGRDIGLARISADSFPVSPRPRSPGPQLAFANDSSG